MTRERPRPRIIDYVCVRCGTHTTRVDDGENAPDLDDSGRPVCRFCAAILRERVPQ